MSEYWPQSSNGVSFRQASKRELAEYGHWFMTTKQSRITHLLKRVGTAQDFSDTSLNMLSEWMAVSIQGRKRSENEIAKMREKIPEYIDVSSVALSENDIEICIDVGTYIGECLIARNSKKQLWWQQVFGSKNSADYGYLCVYGFPHYPMNAVNIAIVRAYKFIGGDRDVVAMSRLQKVWSDKLE
jgi:hypothetical protein